MSETAEFIQLLRKMGHDMRVPLNTLISTSDMLAGGMYDALTPKQTKAVVRLQRNNHRLLAMLDDFVTYVRADKGDAVLTPKVFDPRVRLEDWCNRVRPAAEEKNLTLQLTTSEVLPSALTGDEVALSRIVLALLWNAVAFTAQGAIHVTSEWKSDLEWIISIQDSGAGISDGDLLHIFEPFWRGAERPQMPTAGAGLGLPMSLALAKMMGGNLFLKETGSTGSTFCIQLPMTRGEVTE
jgi:two-component system, sensor histidine kinase